MFFQDITLTCRSEEGSPTPLYKWNSYSVQSIPRAFPPKATESMSEPCFNHPSVTLKNASLRGCWSIPLIDVSGNNAPSPIVWPNFCHYFAEDGALSLFNISTDTSGFYTCTSTNRIGSSSCNLTLAVTPGECFNTIHLAIFAQALSVKAICLWSFVCRQYECWVHCSYSWGSPRRCGDTGDCNLLLLLQEKGQRATIC